MSQAPIRRKSRKALAEAAANVSSQKPAPHQIVLRIKRKRGDAAVDSLLVTTNEGTNFEEDMPNRKRRAGNTSIEDNLAGLSLSNASKKQQPDKLEQNEQNKQAAVQMPTRLCYKRARTTEPSRGSERERPAFDVIYTTATAVGPPSQTTSPSAEDAVGTVGGGGGHLDALLKEKLPSPPAVVDYLEVRRVRAKRSTKAATGIDDSGGVSDHPTPSSASIDAPDIHVIDLQPIGRIDNAVDNAGLGGGGMGGGKGKAAAPQRPAPVLNPAERQIDEAIFAAFRMGDMSSLRCVVASSPSLVNYRRRLGDGTTALMAAAFHGSQDTVRYLLSLGAKASFVDADDKSAALFAGMRGHRECFAELQRVTDEEEEASPSSGKGGVGRDDFVYDLYYFEPSGLQPSGLQGGESVLSDGTVRDAVSPPPVGTDGEKMPIATSGPVVRLSGIGPVDESVVGAVGMELIFEHDSEWSELGNSDAGEDPDSNSEGFYGNDYPEDEGGDDGTGAPCHSDGSSGASDNGSSSNDCLDCDSDGDFHHRRVDSAYSFTDAGLSGLSSFSEDGDRHLAGGAVSTVGPPGASHSLFSADLGKANIFAWDPKRSEKKDHSGPIY